MSKNFNRPKRRIERIRNRIDVLLTAGVVSIVLHAAEDAKTLVRTIINLSIVFINAAASEVDYGIMISRAEKSIVVITPSIAQVLDSPAPIALIWEDNGSLHQADATGPAATKYEKADIKGMRKLKEGDTIELSHLASAASVIRIVGTVTLFFKE